MFQTTNQELFVYSFHMTQVHSNSQFQCRLSSPRLFPIFRNGIGHVTTYDSGENVANPSWEMVISAVTVTYDSFGHGMNELLQLVGEKISLI